MIFQLVGWAGSVILALCALPQVILTWQTKRVESLSFWFLLMWTAGEVLTLAYIIWIDFERGVVQIPLYFNYGFNIVLVGYLLYAKLKYSVKIPD